MQLVTLGEILIDFLQVSSENGQPTFVAQPGGAPANVACAAAKLGISSAFVGKVGADNFGLQLRHALQKNGVDTSAMAVSEQFPTTLAFVHLAPDGDRSFSFYRQGCADTQLQVEELNEQLLTGCDIFHFGSNSMTNAQNEQTTLYALQLAKKNGAMISFDPNIREMLWTDPTNIKPTIEKVLQQVDVLKVSEEELFLLADTKCMEEAVEKIKDNYNISIIVVTRGGNGVSYLFQEKLQHISGHRVKTIDTTGAGDSFVGALLAGFIKNKTFGELTEQQLRHIMLRANRAAAYSTTKHGAIPSYPSDDDIDRL